MGRTWTTEVGHSTRAFGPGDVDAGVVAAIAAGGNVVELSALDAEALDPVAAAARSVALRNFRRVSVHAPARGAAIPEADLVARLAGLGLPVVVHPEVIGHATVVAAARFSPPRREQRRP